MIILGIDPGSINTGYGILRVTNGQIQYLEHGVLKVRAADPFNSRLHQIAQQLAPLFERTKPAVTVVEQIFLGKNADSAFKLGHIRGVCLMLAAQNGSAIVEYAARSVKKGVTGNGGATKEQVQMILFALLGLQGRRDIELQVDASDALSLAFYHAGRSEIDERLRRMTAPKRGPEMGGQS